MFLVAKSLFLLTLSLLEWHCMWLPDKMLPFFRTECGKRHATSVHFGEGAQGTKGGSPRPGWLFSKFY